jgi:urea transport system permease protein
LQRPRITTMRGPLWRHRLESRVINIRQLFIAIAAALMLMMGTAAARAAAPDTSRAGVLAAFCATDGDKASALAQAVERGVSSDASERAWATQIVEAMRNGALVCGGDGHVTIQGKPSLDAASLQPVAGSPSSTDAAYVPGILMMRKLAVAAAEINLFSNEPDKRAAAARQIDKFFSLLDPAIVARASKQEHDPDIATTLTLALAKRGLNSNVKADRLAAIKAVAQVPSETARTALANFAADDSVRDDPELRSAVQGAIRDIDTWLSFGKAMSILFSGLSYAGVLLLTALGLSIVFGLMGVINLAHGEFIMIGAYSTWLVERFMQAHLPALFDTYIFVAIPVAFVVCAVCGMLLEFFVIRFLYRRPLETLLATWAVSIALIKLVQVLFGSQNVEFVTPGFLNGGMQVAPGFFVTYNRLFAIGLALLIFVGTFAVIRLTKLGLLMRATTQLRDMAKCLGVPAERVDRFAFGLGAGLAGLAGVVLTQIASVNPSMGTGFVVDAFMVVVLGGAGSLVGTAVSSLALGEINQFIEPFYGAVAAKVAVLLLIVLIIQKRPQGLFVLKTRT